MNISRLNPNLAQLVAAAERLRPLLDQIAFLGGCVTGLLLTDPAAAPVRPTLDVDAIVGIASYAEFILLEHRLRELGFRESRAEGAPICRWLHGDLSFDLMPTNASILGFSNRWHGPALENVERLRVGEHEIQIHHRTLFSGHETGGVSWSRQERLPHEPRPGGHRNCNRRTTRARGRSPSRRRRLVELSPREIPIFIIES